MSSFTAWWRAPLFIDSLLLVLISTAARGLSALAAVLVAYSAGTGAAMDQYIAFTLATVSFCVLTSTALPSIASSVISKGGIYSVQARGRVRRWSVVISNYGAAVFLLLVPLMAWLFTPHDGTSPLPLAILLGVGTFSVFMAPRLAAEQTLLQGLGHAKLSTAYSVACAVSMCLGSVATAITGDVVWAAVGFPVGTVLEYLLLRRKLKSITRRQEGNEQVAGSAEDPTVSRVPWKAYAIFTGAALSAFVLGPVDQALLARLGEGAQALWGLAGRPASFLSTTFFSVVGVMGTMIAVKSDLTQLSVFREKTYRLAFWTTLGMAAALALMWLIGEPMMVMLYERGSFTREDSLETASVLGLTVWTYVLYPASVVMVRALSALHMYRPLLWSAGAFIVTKIALGVGLLGHLGMMSLTISTTAAMATQLLVLWYALNVATAKQQAVLPSKS